MIWSTCNFKWRFCKKCHHCSVKSIIYGIYISRYIKKYPCDDLDCGRISVLCKWQGNITYAIKQCLITEVCNLSWQKHDKPQCIQAESRDKLQSTEDLPLEQLWEDVNSHRLPRPYLDTCNNLRLLPPNAFFKTTPIGYYQVLQTTYFLTPSEIPTWSFEIIEFIESDLKRCNSNIEICFVQNNCLEILYS